MLNQSIKVVRKGYEVDSALEAIGLSRAIVEKVARAAAVGRSEALLVDPASAGGLFSYIYGVRAIRTELLQRNWRMSRQGNVESTVNDELGIQVCFQNVDAACDEDRCPQAISLKGAGSRRLVAAGQGELFDVSAVRDVGGVGAAPTVWVICVSVDESSMCAEVSCPKTFDGPQYEDFHHRIFAFEEHFDPTVTHADSDLDLDSDGDMDFDVQISRK